MVFADVMLNFKWLLGKGEREVEVEVEQVCVNASYPSFRTSLFHISALSLLSLL